MPDMAIDPLSTLKQIKDLVQKYNDLPLMKQILDLQTEVFELQTENISLKDELATLKRQRDQREKLDRRGPMNYYYQDGDDVPFCPKCLENDGKPIHLTAPESRSGGISRFCRVCKETYWEKPTSPQPIRRARFRSR